MSEQVGRGVVELRGPGGTGRPEGESNCAGTTGRWLGGTESVSLPQPVGAEGKSVGMRRTLGYYATGRVGSSNHGERVCTSVGVVAGGKLKRISVFHDKLLVPDGFSSFYGTAKFEGVVSTCSSCLSWFGKRSLAAAVLCLALTSLASLRVEIPESRLEACLKNREPPCLPGLLSWARLPGGWRGNSESLTIELIQPPVVQPAL